MENVEKSSINNKHILYFFIYSVLGWILETVYAYIVLGHFENRGFLIGPMCPIYGFGMLILTVGLEKYKGHNAKLFFVAAFVLTYFEYLAGFALDVVFGLKWWDYTNDFLNINGRICLFFTVSWGIIALLVVNYIHPFTEKIVDKALNKTTPIMLDIVVKVFVMILIIDFLLSSIAYIH